ncbi:hypothetical protein ACNR9Q_12320 [Maribacter sp. X9]|uniref:hypothetical protein n=1 Tax=Maribacter sp. X9 TaxID=3402159 RepID=UPI003AF3B919
MRLFLLLFTLFLLFSCNELKKENTRGTDEVLDDFSKMPDSIFMAGFKMLETLEETSFSKALALLQKEPNVTEIGVGDSLLSFRVSHGPMMLVPFGEGIPGTKGLSARSLSTAPFLTVQDEKDHVVAAQREDREHKKALILAPYLWEFGQNEDALVPLKKLENQRNYRGRITYKVNSTKNAQNISLDDYTSFEAYDMIYISSHGSMTCITKEGGIEITNGGLCHSFISTGVRLKKSELPQFKKSIGSEVFNGIAFSRSQEEGIIDVELLPEFFENHYKALENKLIIISACQLGQRGDIGDTFGKILRNSQLFYWQNTIDANDAKKAFSSLYDRMLDYGETAPVAFENMPDALKKNIPYFKDVKKQGDSVEVFNYLKLASQGNAMHLIEPVTFIDEKTRRPLDEGQVFPFEGIFEDNLPESANFTLELLGYDQNEMQQGHMTLTLKVDGETVLDNQSFLPDTDPYDHIEVQNGKNEKTTWVTFKGIDLRKDLKKNSSVKLEALFHFDGEHYGYQSLQVSTGSSDMRIEMEHEGDHITMYFDADNYGLKMVIPKENQTMYGDEQGFMYVHSDGEGWIKTEMKGMFAAIGSKMPINLDFLNDLPAKGTFLHKIPAFAATLTIAKLEQEPRAKKISGPLDAKTVFLADGHVKITFDAQKRLESLEDQGYIKYYYEPQKVTFPKAKLFQMPSF